MEKSAISTVLERMVEEMLEMQDRTAYLHDLVTVLLTMADQSDEAMSARVLSIGHQWAKAREALNQRNKTFAEDIDELLKAID